MYTPSLRLWTLSAHICLCGMVLLTFALQVWCMWDVLKLPNQPPLLCGSRTLGRCCWPHRRTDGCAGPRLYWRACQLLVAPRWGMVSGPGMQAYVCMNACLRVCFSTLSAHYCVHMCMCVYVHVCQCFVQMQMMPVWALYWHVWACLHGLRQAE